MLIKVQRALFVLPAVLLIFVAGWQAIRVETHDQSPWIGAGFAMFVYVDGAQYRPLVAVAADDPSVGIAVPPDLRREADRLKAAPTTDRAARFATALSAASGRPVRVEIWRPVWDAESLTLSAELIVTGRSR